MRKTFLIIVAIAFSSPALSEDAGALRELSQKHLNAAADDGETGTTDKGCAWQKVPKWFRDKYLDNKGVFLVQDIQNTLIGENVTSTGVCSCADIYPSWDEAIAIYETDFKKLNAFAEFGTETHSFLNKYHRRSQELIMSARSICQKAGVF